MAAAYSRWVIPSDSRCALMDSGVVRVSGSLPLRGSSSPSLFIMMSLRLVSRRNETLCFPSGLIELVMSLLVARWTSLLPWLATGPVCTSPSYHLHTTRDASVILASPVHRYAALKPSQTDRLSERNRARASATSRPFASIKSRSSSGVRVSAIDFALGFTALRS